MNTTREQRRRECEGATDQIIAEAGEATRRLAILMTNGYGILADPSMVRSNLADARDAINRALVVLGQVNWPTEDEYDSWMDHRIG